MNRDFEKCLKNRRIVKQDFTDGLISPELEDSRSDLLRTKKTFDEPDYKWATIQAYYAMFHAARALLFAKGYREKSHVCLKYAIQALYVDEGTLDQKYIEQFDVTMLLRETADYKRDFSRDGAEMALNNLLNTLHIASPSHSWITSLLRPLSIFKSHIPSFL